MCAMASLLLLGQEGPPGLTALVYGVYDKLSLPSVLWCSGEGGMEALV